MANPIDLATLFREQIGGRRNLIINGAMQVAQRGTSIACPASTLTYTMDRFFAQPAGNAATTVSQVTDAPVGFQYSARVTRNSGQTGTLTRFETPFETRDIVNLREKKVTVSFYAKAGSNLSTSSNAISLLLFEGDGTERARGASGYDNQTVLINSPKTLTTSWQRFTHTTSSAVSSDTTQLAVQFQAIWTGTAGSNDEFFITGIQLEVGETATPFEHRSYGEELALCQRYYQVIAYSTVGQQDGAYSTDHFSVPFNVMRALPTLDAFTFTKVGHVAGSLTNLGGATISYFNNAVDFVWSSTDSGYRNNGYRVAGSMSLKAEL